MSLKKIFYLSILIACCQVPMAQAGLITLNEFDSGEVVYRRVGFFCNGTESASHSSGLDNLSTEIRPCGILGSLITTQTWGYLIFDLAPVTGTVNSATVSFTIAFTLPTSMWLRIHAPQASKLKVLLSC